MTKLRRVLVSNRGEIAVRIIRALKIFGAESVAVFSDADASAKHVSMADRAYRLPGVFATETYLDAEKIIEIARKADCDAIHPGYGLLSETSGYAKLCEDNGIKFIGPTPTTLEISANKLECKKLVESHGIPVVAYSHDPLHDPDAAARFASEIGFPVLLKSAFGGGGRGIREAKNRHEVKSAFEASRREAESSFGRFAVYVEKKLVNPRHLEVQIIASDDAEEVIHVGERECSIQRRYQKLVEISPSPVIDQDSRAALCDYAVRVAKIVKYSNVGTVEFLRDSAGNFYFLEINSRLQVEHPVTEFVSGLDIVNIQLEIAAKKKMPFRQSDIRLTGCAMEFRINAEDPLHDFSPTTGKIEYLQLPYGPGVRVDTSLEQGMVVSPYYDSLVAKLVTYGVNFDQARKRALVALDEFAIYGIETTIPFHRELVRNERFARGDITTTFIESTGLIKNIAGFADQSLDEHHFMIAALLLSRNQFPDRDRAPSLTSKGQTRTRSHSRGRFTDAL